MVAINHGFPLKLIKVTANWSQSGAESEKDWTAIHSQMSIGYASGHPIGPFRAYIQIVTEVVTEKRNDDVYGLCISG